MTTFCRGGTVVDLGSGAGLPGIPLALVFPKWNFTLAERKEKRVRFLELAIKTLNLTNVKVWPFQFEEMKLKFPFAVFRAFSPLEPELMKVLKKVLTPEGWTLAYKGRLEVIDAEVKAVSAWTKRVSIEKITVPFLDEERHAVIFQLQ